LKNNDKVWLQKGQKFSFVTDQDELGDETKVSTTYTHLSKTSKIGDKILVEDGLIQFKVEEVRESLAIRKFHSFYFSFLNQFFFYLFHITLDTIECNRF